MELGIVRLGNLQFVYALSPMEVTEEGIEKLVNPELAKARVGMVVIPLAKVTLVRDVQ